MTNQIKDLLIQNKDAAEKRFVNADHNLYQNTISLLSKVLDKQFIDLDTVTSENRLRSKPNTKGVTIPYLQDRVLLDSGSSIDLLVVWEKDQHNVNSCPFRISYSKEDRKIYAHWQKDTGANTKIALLYTGKDKKMYTDIPGLFDTKLSELIEKF